MARRVGGTLVGVALRDNGNHPSRSIRKAPGIIVFTITNTLDQTVLVTFQGANDLDGTLWANLPNPVTVVNGTGTGIATITDPHKWIRATYVAAGVPTTGIFTIAWSWEG